MRTHNYLDDILNIKEFGESMRDWREYAGYSQAGLADAVNQFVIKNPKKMPLKSKVLPSVYLEKIKFIESGEFLNQPVPESMERDEEQVRRIREARRTAFSGYAFLIFETCRAEIERNRHPVIYPSLDELIDDRGAQIKNGHALRIEAIKAEAALPRPAVPRQGRAFAAAAVASGRFVSEGTDKLFEHQIGYANRIRTNLKFEDQVPTDVSREILQMCMGIRALVERKKLTPETITVGYAKKYPLTGGKYIPAQFLDGVCAGNPSKSYKSSGRLLQLAHDLNGSPITKEELLELGEPLMSKGPPKNGRRR